MHVLEFWDGVTGILDEGDPVDIGYPNFQKAFDMVPVKRFSCKLAFHGIDGNVQKEIQKWLCIREQRVVTNVAESKWVWVPSEVLQGSVLGPVLFIKYNSEIDYAVDAIVKKFEDDTIIYEWVRTGEQVL